jgi:DNA repair protein SbcD/Mre11
MCAGDIHIGRRSSRVVNAFRTADAWDAIVDKTIQADVDLLAISGDLIDKENKSYEAIGVL